MTSRPFLTFVCLCFAIGLTGIHAGYAGPASMPKYTAKQKAAAYKVIASLKIMETKLSQGVITIEYDYQLQHLQWVTAQPMQTLPDGYVKTGLSASIQLYADAQTIRNEVAATPFKDLLKRQQTGAILQKYGIPYSLDSNNPYDRVSGSDEKALETVLIDAAKACRQRSEAALH